MALASTRSIPTEFSACFSACTANRPTPGPVLAWQFARRLSNTMADAFGWNRNQAKGRYFTGPSRRRHTPLSRSHRVEEGYTHEPAAVGRTDTHLVGGRRPRRCASHPGSLEGTQSLLQDRCRRRWHRSARVPAPRGTV